MVSRNWNTVVITALASVSKAVDKLANLQTELARKPLVWRVSIWHMGWAAHGVANTINAHPYRAEHVMFVRNGIIENYAELKSELITQGLEFALETETEFITQLIYLALRTASTLDEAFSKILAKLVGSCAIALIDHGVLIIVLSSNDELNEKTQSNAAVVVARGPRLIEVGCEVAAADHFVLPKASDTVMPFLYAASLQMISYHAVLAKGTDLDQPKNLSKLVTLE